MQPLHSIRHVVETQSRRIGDINTQPENAQCALIEREVVDQPKDGLMRCRRLSEKAADTVDIGWGVAGQTTPG
jgi:hypothetical protein